MIKDEITEESPVKKDNVDEQEEEGFDAMEDIDDDLMSDDYDSASEKSHENRKKSKWFKVFFENLDSLSIDKINELERQWHCPACRGGPGAIDWYKGLQPLITHAKTKGSKRVKIHREFVELLDEELLRRGTAVIPAGEVFGKWKGLKDEEKDHEIVWPPMVVIQNTRLKQDENDKVSSNVFSY
ncbi:LOW QUALITY PROTEIN: protein SUPPRESSOR OF GENE SILENCING 3-like [Phaseolus vulgaris]|uniref:LOW QUALITY PROTEIN: protein SUPPRESSOR OF GENE SILENCING 3-like n=1 Tax=Phaseolus vulgaris TaxID=3885 RepID=UPI0035CB9C9D